MINYSIEEIKLSFIVGTDIGEARKAAIIKAMEFNCKVSFDFNGRIYFVTPETLGGCVLNFDPKEKSK